MTVTREVAWGDALVVQAFRTTGGLKAAVDAIIAVVGPTIGVRNTFAKLFYVNDPSELGERDAWRAWLLLTAMQQEPSEWGLSNDCVPSAIDVVLLRTQLRDLVRREGIEPPTRWLSANCSARRETVVWLCDRRPRLVLEAVAA